MADVIIQISPGGGGSGGISGSTTSVSGDIVIYTGTSGQVVADSGIKAASILTSGVVVPGAGDVVGPPSSISGNVTFFSDTTGKLIGDTGIPAGSILTSGVVISGVGGTWVSGSTTSVSGDIVIYTGTSGQVVADSNILAKNLVSGPSSSTSGHLVNFNGVGGKVLADSGILMGNLVSGPASSTSGNIVIFASAGGKTISDSGRLAGNLVSGAATSTSHDVIIFADGTGKALEDSNVLADPSTGSLTSISGIYRDLIAGVTNLRSGWPNRTDSTISFNNGTRQFQISPTGTSFTFYIANISFTFSSAQNVIISNTVGLWYIWFDNAGVLNASQTLWDFSSPIALVATIYWNGTTGLLNEERHGMVMDWADHLYLHTTVGTRYVNGLTGTFNADSTFSVTTGQIDDEDIQIPITTQTTCQVFWRTAGPGPFTFTVPQTGFFLLNGSRIEYDNNGVLTDVPVGDFVAYFVFATDNIATPIFVITGQRVDTSLANAEANAVPSSLSLGTLPSAEMKLIFVVYVHQTNATTQAIAATVDYRGSSSLPITNYVPTAHSSLTGLIAPADDHTQYVLDGLAGSTSGNLSMYADTSGRTINDSGILAATLVSGPASAVSGDIVIFNGTGGKILANSGILAASILTSGSVFNSWASFPPNPSWGTATPTIISTVARYVRNGNVTTFASSITISDGGGNAVLQSLDLPVACTQVSGYRLSLISFKSITTGGNSIMSDPFAYVDYTVATPNIKFRQFGTLRSGYSAMIDVSGSYEVNT